MVKIIKPKLRGDRLLMNIDPILYSALVKHFKSLSYRETVFLYDTVVKFRLSVESVASYLGE